MLFTASTDQSKEVFYLKQQSLLILIVYMRNTYMISKRCWISWRSLRFEHRHCFVSNPLILPDHTASEHHWNRLQQKQQQDLMFSFFTTYNLKVTKQLPSLTAWFLKHTNKSVTNMGFEFYTKPQLDIVLHQTAWDRYSYCVWWRAPAASVNSQYISKLISPVLTVSEDTSKSTIGRNYLII